MLVSIIIPTYNCADFLPSTLESIRNQYYSNTEIIVVDDGSTDNTAEVINPYLDHITYIHQNNQGVSAARNNAILHSSGDLIAFIDADDNWNPEKLMIQVNILEKHKDLTGVFSDFSIADQHGKITSTSHVKNNYRIFSTYNLEWDDIFPLHETIVTDSLLENNKTGVEIYYGNMFKALFLGNFINTSSLVLRKSVVSKYGLFNVDRKTQEDYEYWLKVAKNETFAFVDKPLLYSRRRANQLTSKSNQEDICKNSLEVVEAIAATGIDGLVDKHVIEARLADMYHSYAISLLGSNKKSKARANIVKSLTTKGFDIKSLALYLWTYLPNWIADSLRKRFRSSQN